MTTFDERLPLMDLWWCSVIRSSPVGLGVNFVSLPPITTTKNYPYQNLPEGIITEILEIWHWDLSHKIKTRWQLSVTIPWMVTHHSKDGHPTSKIIQKKDYYRLELWHLDLTHKIKTRWSTMDSHPQSQGWEPTIPRMVTNHPKLKSTRMKCTTDLEFGT